MTSEQQQFRLGDIIEHIVDGMVNYKGPITRLTASEQEGRVYTENGYFCTQEHEEDPKYIDLMENIYLAK